MVFQAFHDQETPAVLSEKACCIHFAHPGDRATPGSDPSAAVGGLYGEAGLARLCLVFFDTGIPLYAQGVTGIEKGIFEFLTALIYRCLPTRG